MGSLIDLVRPLNRRTDRAGRISEVALRSFLHHVLVLASVAAVSVGNGASHLFRITALACAIGLLHAGLLLVARAALVASGRKDQTPPRPIRPRPRRRGSRAPAHE